eukprot:4830031-Alexandrium_andersonii.AAC.1
MRPGMGRLPPLRGHLPQGERNRSYLHRGPSGQEHMRSVHQARQRLDAQKPHVEAPRVYVCPGRLQGGVREGLVDAAGGGTRTRTGHPMD